MTSDLDISSEGVRIVSCPTCRGDSVFAPSNTSRPFCSPRCKNMDLGAWANEEFRVNTADTTNAGDIDEAGLA